MKSSTHLWPMPITPIHLGFAWPVWLLNRKKLHFMSLSFGAMAPDLEVPFMLLFSPDGAHARGMMHSILGALTIDILIALFFVYFIVPPVGRWVKSRSKEKWHIFAGKDVTRAPTDPLWALASAVIGTLSHVFIDMFTHKYNPIYWPYKTDMDINLLPFESDITSTLVIAAPMFIVVLILALRYWTRPFK